MLEGYRRYIIVIVGVVTAGYGFLFGEPLDQQAVSQIVTDVGSAVTAVLALLSALRPAPAAGVSQ